MSDSQPPTRTDSPGATTAIHAQLLTDEDIQGAMKEIPGYLDITTGDFRELYQHAFRHAIERLSRSVRVGDIMRRQVITVSVATPLSEVASRMAAAGVSGVPVLAENGQLAGIISERDFLRHMGGSADSFMAIVASCLQGQGCSATTIRRARAGDVMSRPAVSIRENACLGEAAASLVRYDINRLPVLTGSGDRLAGILTRSDLVRARFPV